MAATRKLLAEMFSRFLNIELTDEVMDRLEPMLVQVEKRIREELDLNTVQGSNSLRMLLASVMAYGWGTGMHPYHNPDADRSGKSLEVRASKDILVPIKDLRSIRYLKKDRYGRVRKALFEPDQNAQVRSQIDKLLDEIALSKWQEEEF